MMYDTPPRTTKWPFLVFDVILLALAGFILNQATHPLGLVEIAAIDYYKSYVDDIRIINNSQLEVDTCEVWTIQFYRRSDGSLAQSNDAQLLPQTITIQKINNGWFITTVEFFEAPAFCQG